MPDLGADCPIDTISYHRVKGKSTSSLRLRGKSTGHGVKSKSLTIESGHGRRACSENAVPRRDLHLEHGRTHSLIVATVTKKIVEAPSPGLPQKFHRESMAIDRLSCTLRFMASSMTMRCSCCSIVDETFVPLPIAIRF